MDGGLSFHASSEVYGGESLDLAVGSGELDRGSGSVLGERMKRARPQRERDSGDSFLATTVSLPRPIALGSNTAQPSAR